MLINDKNHEYIKFDINFLSELLKLFANTTGWDQDKLEEFSDINKRTISRISACKTSGDRKTRRKLATLFGFDDVEKFNKTYLVTEQKLIKDSVQKNAQKISSMNLNQNIKETQKKIRNASIILRNKFKLENTIEDEINKVESFFIKEKILENFSLNISVFFNHQDSSYDSEIVEFLVWRAEEQKVYFVSCRLIPTIDPVTLEEIYDLAPIEERPLVDTSFQVRKRVYENRHLPQLIEKFTEQFRLKTSVVAREVDDTIFHDDRFKYSE